MFFDFFVVFFFCKQKTAYEMRISDWSSDVCSSDLHEVDMAVKSLGHRVEGTVHAGLVFDIAGHDGLGADALGQRTDAALEGLALVGEGEFGAVLVQQDRKSGV